MNKYLSLEEKEKALEEELTKFGVTRDTLDQALEELKNEFFARATKQKVS